MTVVAINSIVFIQLFNNYDSYYCRVLTFFKTSEHLKIVQTNFLFKFKLFKVYSYFKHLCTMINK